MLRGEKKSLNLQMYCYYEILAVKKTRKKIQITGDNLRPIGLMSIINFNS